MGATELDLGYQYRGLRNRSTTIRQIEAQAKAKGLNYGGLAEDIFNLLYQRSPQLRADLDPNSKYTDIIRAVAASPTFEGIRKRTRGDIYWSGLGAGVLISEVANKINLANEPPPQPKPKNPPPPDDEQCDNPQPSDKPGDKESDESDEESDENTTSNSPKDSDDESQDENENESEPENQSGEDESDDESRPNPGDNPDDDSDSDGDDSESDEDSESEDGDSDDSSDSENDDDSESEGDSEDGEDGESTDGEWGTPAPIGEMPAEDSPQVDPNSKEISEAIQEAINDAAEKLGEQIGGLEAGKGKSQLTEKDKLQTMDAFAKIATNRYLSDIIRNIGRLRLDNRFMSAMAVGDPEETVGITYGKDIKEALPQEIALAVGDAAEFFAFADRYDGGKMLVRENKNTEHVGKGPIVACVDRSGSMSSRRTKWASTLCLALYLQSVKENRPFALVQFGSMAKTFEPNSQKVLDPNFIATINGEWDGGGTDFNYAWTHAIQFIAKNKAKSTWKNADIAFITDGEDFVDKEEWLKAKDKFGVRLFTFIIEMTEAAAFATYQRRGELELRHSKECMWDFREIADGMMFVGNLDEADEHTAFNMIRSNAQKKGYSATAKRK